MAAAPIDSLLHPNDPSSRGSDLAFRRVTVTGTYDTANEVIIRARSLNERPGVWVATPLRLAERRCRARRPRFPADAGHARQPCPPTPSHRRGQVTVEGLVQETQTRGLFGATDPSEGHLSDLARVDVARLQKQVPYPLYPVWVQLQTTQPAQVGEPEVLPEPVLDEGPHLSYAVQWFIFSTIALVGYPLILRRSARNRGLLEDVPSDEVSEPVPVTAP